MLNKEFIPYELALALKKLGFDEPCFGRYYYKESYPMLNTKSKETELVFEFGQYLKQTEVTILAPTFSQAFRWFREKYGWVAEIHGSLQMNRFYANLLLQAKGQVNNIKMCDTYEEAENACINKLIEIVKQK